MGKTLPSISLPLPTRHPPTPPPSPPPPPPPPPPLPFVEIMLSKRPRTLIRRTTSMTGITVDVDNFESNASVNPQNPISNELKTLESSGEHVMSGPIGYDQRSMAMLSPRYYRRGADDNHIETAHFLRTCGLCNRRLAPGRDIYMYRGDTAFCSLECREQRMKQDERKEKCKMRVSENGEICHDHSQVATAASEASSKKDTIAAA